MMKVANGLILVGERMVYEGRSRDMDQPGKVFINGLPKDIEDQHLEFEFSKFGNIVEGKQPRISDYNHIYSLEHIHIYTSQSCRNQPIKQYKHASMHKELVL